MSQEDEDDDPFGLNIDLSKCPRISLDDLRGEVDSQKLLKRLTRHGLGLEDMTVTEVQAARIALAKTMPDMKAVEHSGKVAFTNASELTDEQLADIAAGSGNRVVKAPARATKPN